MDIGVIINLNLKDYNLYYNKSKKNLLIIHKCIKTEIDLINEDAIMINKRYIFVYFK